MGKVKDVCVLGGGNGAHAVAGHLALKGYRVRMAEIPEFADKFKKVLNSKHIKISGVVEGLATLEMATTNYKEAISGSDIVFITVPAFAHKNVFDRASKYLEKGQIVVFTPGNFSALMAYKVLKEMGKENEVIIAETTTLPYGARMVEEGHVRIIIQTVCNPVAAMPAYRTMEVVNKLKELYPEVMNGGNVIQVAASNPNPNAHPVATILNAGRIEFADTFYLYREGFTPSIHTVVKRIDKEKRKVLDELGMKIIEPGKTEGEFSALDAMSSFFGPDALAAGQQMVGPLSLKDRYVTEDIPYGYKPISLLGKVLGVKTPVTDAIIAIASAINKTNYMEEGYTLEDLGLAGLSPQQITKYIQRGEVV